MRKIAAFLLMAVPFMGIHAESNSIVISPNNAVSINGERWEGWGTSLCWWANRIGYSDSLTQKAAELFFDREKGLGLNIMRYNVGGGDDPAHNHITRTDSDVPGWMVLNARGRRVWDYGADARQLNVVKAAMKAAGQDAWLEIFSNSAPYFMTVSGCSSGNSKADENNLKDSEYANFAEYMAHVANYMTRTMGLKVRSVSPMNEPNTDYWSAMSRKQEGCHFDAGQAQSRLLSEMSKALHRYNLDNLILVASDETNPGKQIEEIKALSPDARAAIRRINVHTYGTNGIVEMGQMAKDMKMPLWMSEVDGNGTAGVNAGEMAAGLWLAEKIISDIESLKPSAWVLWQVIDTHVSKDGFNGRRDSGPLRTSGGYWGTAWADHDRNAIELTQKYYVFGQFTRYIRPGATFIKCQTGKYSGCKALVARDRRNLTIVCTNSSDRTNDLSFDLSQFKLKGTARQIRTSGSMADGEHWAESSVPVTDGWQLNVSLVPNSVTTFVIQFDTEKDKLKLEDVHDDTRARTLFFNSFRNMFLPKK